MSCAHCEHPHCAICEEAKHCAFCKSPVATNPQTAPLQVDRKTLEACVQSHDNWSNAFVAHQKTKGSISFRKNPGCWLLIWGWPLLIGIAMVIGMVQEASLGRASFGQAFGPLLLILIILTTVLAPVRIAARTLNRVLAQSVALPLTRSDGKAICLECSGSLKQRPNEMWNCEHCKTPHLLPIPLEQAEPDDLLERLSQSKQLGHLAASLTCQAHEVSATAGAVAYKRISRGLFIVTPILAIGLVASGTASTGEGLGIAIFGAGYLGGLSFLMSRLGRKRPVHDATFSTGSVSTLRRLT